MVQSATTVLQQHLSDNDKVCETFFQQRSALLHEEALRLARTIARGGRIFLCTSEGFPLNQIAAHATELLAEGCTLTRPTLPFLHIPAADVKTLLRRLETLGRRGDTLLLLCYDEKESIVQQILRCARVHHWDMALLPCLPPVADTEKRRATHAQPLTAQHWTLAFTALTALCRLIDFHLFENTSALLAEEENH